MSGRVAERYAKALIDLAVEKNSLEEVHQDMLYLAEVCLVSPEFVIVLSSPVINADKKLRILDQIGKGHVGTLTIAFSGLLIRKGRESALPDIIQAVLEQYNKLKGVHTVKLTTATPVGEDLQQLIKDRIKRDLSLDNVVMEAEVDDTLIGGFTLEFDGKMLDASVARDLNDIRKQFIQNMYVPKVFVK